jgi:hypothetical protein
MKYGSRPCPVDLLHETDREIACSCSFVCSLLFAGAEAIKKDRCVDIPAAVFTASMSTSSV